MSSLETAPQNYYNRNLSTAVQLQSPTAAARPVGDGGGIFAPPGATIATTAAAAATVVTMGGAHSNTGAASGAMRLAAAGTAKTTVNNKPSVLRANGKKGTNAKCGAKIKNGKKMKKRPREVDGTKGDGTKEESMETTGTKPTAPKKAKKTATTVRSAARPAASMVVDPNLSSAAAAEVAAAPISPSLPAVIAACLGKVDNDKAVGGGISIVAPGQPVEQERKQEKGKGTAKGRGKEKGNGKASAKAPAVDNEGGGFANFIDEDDHDGEMFLVDELVLGAGEDYNDKNNSKDSGMDHDDEPQSARVGQQSRGTGVSLDDFFDRWGVEVRYYN